MTPLVSALTSELMAISAPSLSSFSPPCRKYGYICTCNYAIVPWFSALLDSSRLFSTSPLHSLKCPCLLLATPLLVRPVCLADYRALVAQVTRVTNLAGVELHIIASAPWLISALERKRRRPPTPSKRTPPPFVPPCLFPAFTSVSQDSPSSRRQEALKRSKPRPGAVARPGNMGERLSAPQSYFLASCRIAAVLHFASFLNALGFDFDISDPPWFLQKQLGRSVCACVCVEGGRGD